MTDAPAEHEFLIRDLVLESGVVLPTARVVYGVYGEPNAARDNVVLAPSHYMADLHGYEWLIGPGLALDPAEVCVVATELFGNGRSSSPSTTPPPFDGPRFPVPTIRDNVAAVHRLLTEELGIGHLRAIVGFSMGAQQAFQWAVDHPGFVDRIVASAGTAKTYPHGVARLEGHIATITGDPAFAGGEYGEQPAAGVRAFGLTWGAWLYSQQWWRDELWRETDPQATFESVLAEFRDDFAPGADANDLILQCRTWQRHDVGTTPGFDGDTRAALRSIADPLLYLPAETDLYFPIGDARFEAADIPSVTLLPIPSLWGHPAGAAASEADGVFLNDAIGRFLAGRPIPKAEPIEP